MLATLILLYSDGKTALKYYSDCVKLENGIYSDEGFIFRLLEILGGCDKDLNGLRKTPINDSYKVYMTSKEKLEVFFRLLSEYTNTDITTTYVPRL